jgi:hypothetical protein
MPKINGPHALIPQDVYDIVFLGEAEDVVLALARENNLSKEDADFLTTLVEDVFLGDVSMGEFPDKIKQVLRLPEEKLQKIISFIKEELFHPFDSSIQEAYRQKVNQRSGTTETKESEPRVVTVPVSTTSYAPPTPVYKPENFGQARNRSENTPSSVVKEGDINYQPGLSLKDTLFKAGPPQNTVTDPKDSSFAKKLEAMGKEKESGAQKEDAYREAPDS